MEEKIRLAVFGQKRLSREGGIEIVVKELCTRMAQNGCDITCYNRAGHHVSGAEYDKTIEYDGIRQKVVPTIEKKGLAAVSSSFFAALCSAFGRYDVVHLDDFGRMLDHTWRLKRQTGSAVSTNSIDDLYAKGVAAGALGGKLLGAGGGGFLVFYVQPERQDAVRWAMRDLMHIPFAFEDGGTRVIHYTPETYIPKE